MSVVVVGGGAVGLSCAYELLRDGHEVTLVEAGVPGAAASHGNAAKIALAESGPVPAPGVLLQGIRWMMRRDSPLAVAPHLAPDYVRFMLTMARHCNAADFTRGLELNLALADDANDLLDGYLRDGMDFEMHARGVLLAFESRERFDEQVASLRTYRAFGHDPELLHGAAVQEREPALADRIRHGLFFGADRQLDPDALTAALVARCLELGLTLRDRTTVSDIVRTADSVTHVVLGSGERIPADTVVLAAGVGVGPLTGKLGLPLPIQGGKGYSIDYSPPPISLRTSLTLEDARVAVTPLNGFLRLAGTMEFGSRTAAVDEARVQAIRKAAAASLRDWPADFLGERTAWAGMRPMTPDGLPTIGRLGPLRNAIVAGGHGMLGLTMAPGTGRLVADLVAERTPTLAGRHLDLLDPARFLRSRSRPGLRGRPGPGLRGRRPRIAV